jgi:tripartite ATP-independent transporter DctM subunit
VPNDGLQRHENDLAISPTRIAGWQFCERLRGWLAAALGLILFCLLMAELFTVLAGVIARYVFNASFPWTEEFASWTLICLTYTGMAAGHASGRHLSVNVIEALFSPRARRLSQLVSEIIVAFTTCMLLGGGTGVIERISGISTGLQWDNRIKYLVIPTASLLSLILLVLVDIGKGRSWSRSLLPIIVGSGLCVVIAFVDPPFTGISPSLIMSTAFLASLAIGVPIGFAMLFGVFLSTWGADLLPIVGVVNTMVIGASSFVLLAIPFFLTAGYLMNAGGLATRLIDFASALVGHFRGGLAQANVFHSVMLGGICGSSGADAASTTKILVPEMIRRGYSGPFACAVTAVGSILPNCFPPSIAILVYASISNVSVAQLFTAGIVPGLLMCALMMVTVRIIATHRNYEKAPHRASIGVMAMAGVRALPATIQAVVILGLLRFGVMTATEVGIVAVLWSFVIGKFIYRGFTWTEFYRDMVECALDSGLIIFLICVASPFAWVLIAEEMPQHMLGWLTSTITGKWQLLMMINIVAFSMGCFLEVVPSMLILVPLLSPLTHSLGINPIHLGIVIVLNLLLASVSPPIGILVFISASIARIPTGAVFRECLPFVLACGLGVVLVTYMPAISLTLWQFISR